MSQKDNNVKTKSPKGAWLVMIIVFVAACSLAVAQYKAIPLIPSFIGDLHVNATDAGWIVSMFTLIGIVLAFPAVAIIKKWGIRIGGIVSLLFAILGGLLGLFVASDQVTIMVSRIIEGFGLGLIGVIAPSAIAMWFPIEKRGAPMGLFSGWQQVGIASSMFLGAPLIESFGKFFSFGPDGTWHWMILYVIGLVILVVALILYALIVKDPPRDQNHADVQDTAGISIFSVVKIKNVWFVVLAGFAFGVANSVVIAWICTFWTTTGALGTFDPTTVLTPEVIVGVQGTPDYALANIFTGIMYAIEVFACFGFGLILNKITRRRRFIVIDSVLYAVIFFMIFQVNFFAGIIAMVILYSVIESGFCAAMWTLVTQTVPDPRYGPGAIALFTIAIDVGMMLGNPIGGFFIDNGWPWWALSILVCIAQLVAAAGYGFMKLYNEKGEEVKI
ncbi:MAG: MFS transporter [Coriobacteriales bacterium]|nr:MFS transporter [Coriobacteriales bacterium]